MVIVTISACDDPITEPTINYDALIDSHESKVVLQWNEALGSAIENNMPQAVETRIYAMVSLAMHDALNNVVPRYETYALNNGSVSLEEITDLNISPISDAAVAQAAHDVLVALVPTYQPKADSLLNLHLSEIDSASFRSKGVSIGVEAASAMLAKRQNDPIPSFTSYSKGTEPGMYQANYMPYALANPPIWPEKAVYGENIGDFTPFGIETADQFRPNPPYAVTSNEYIIDYEEVRNLGCTSCTERTADQTEVGSFWRESTSGLMNQVARILANEEELNGWEAARLFALIQMAQIDANIATFEAKYHYSYWTVVTAVRAGESDGNDWTFGDVNWTPVSAPPTPDYPSTPAAAGAASAEIFRQFFGTDNKTFSIKATYYLPGVERNYASFSAAAAENNLSKIYLGSNFRNSVSQGERQGQQIGKFVFENNLRELEIDI